MRFTKHGSPHGSPEEIRERYLGEIASLLAAARNVEPLSPPERAQLRQRIARTAFAGHGARRPRLMPVLAGLGLIVAGGLAFATAQRLGLFPRHDGDPAGTAPARRTAEGPQHRRERGQVGPVVSPAPLSVEMDPPGVGAAPPAAESLPDAPAPTASGGAAAPAGSPTPGGAGPAGRRGVHGGGTHAGIANLRKRERVQSARMALATPYLSEQALPAVPSQAALTGQAFIPSSTPSSDTAPPSSLLARTERADSGPRAATGAASAPPKTEPAPPLASDAVLFGLALHELRNDNAPALALATLEEHARAYPRSPLAGERGTLQVEALLALHRDREALQKLDGMSLDQLPRSGERFVVRGELRAAARRWLDAKNDFEQALSLISGSPAWHERALWGRAVARLRCGEQEAGMADMERYRDIYPNGRFAAEASKFFPGR